MELRAIGIDLGKTVFHLVGLNRRDAGVIVAHKWLAAESGDNLRFARAWALAPRGCFAGPMDRERTESVARELSP